MFRFKAADVCRLHRSMRLNVVQMFPWIVPSREKKKCDSKKKQIRRCNDFIKPTRRKQLLQLLVEANLPQCLTPNPVKNKSQECITQLLYWAVGWHEQVNTMTNTAWSLKQKKKTRIKYQTDDHPINPNPLFYPLIAMHKPRHVNPFPVVKIHICHLQ